MQTVKFRCRPDDRIGYDDPYYEKEVEVNVTGSPGSRWDAQLAAEQFAAAWCNDRSEYPPDFAVQVVIDGQWVPFDITIRSVPEFVATRRKDAPTEPYVDQADQVAEEEALMTADIGGDEEGRRVAENRASDAPATDEDADQSLRDIVASLKLTVRTWSDRLEQAVRAQFATAFANGWEDERRRVGADPSLSSHP